MLRLLWWLLVGCDWWPSRDTGEDGGGDPACPHRWEKVGEHEVSHDWGDSVETYVVYVLRCEGCGQWRNMKIDG